MHEDPGGAEADLPLVGEGTPCEGAHGVLKVAVLKDNGRVLTPQLRRQEISNMSEDGFEKALQTLGLPLRRDGLGASRTLTPKESPVTLI